MIKRSYFIRSTAKRGPQEEVASWTVVDMWSLFPQPVKIVHQYLRDKEAAGLRDILITEFRRV